MSPDLWTCFVVLAACWLFFNGSILVWVWVLSRRVENDRESLTKIRSDCEKGIDALDLVRCEAQAWFGKVKARATVEPPTTTTSTKSKPKVTPASKPGALSAGDRFRRLMEDDDEEDGAAGTPVRR